MPNESAPTTEVVNNTAIPAANHFFIFYSAPFVSICRSTSITRVKKQKVTVTF